MESDRKSRTELLISVAGLVVALVGTTAAIAFAAQACSDASKARTDASNTQSTVVASQARSWKPQQLGSGTLTICERKRPDTGPAGPFIFDDTFEISLTAQLIMKNDGGQSFTVQQGTVNSDTSVGIKWAPQSFENLIEPEGAPVLHFALPGTVSRGLTFSIANPRFGTTPTPAPTFREELGDWLKRVESMNVDLLVDTSEILPIRIVIGETSLKGAFCPEN